MPRGRSAPFPCARQLTLLERMGATWKVSPSLKQSSKFQAQTNPTAHQTRQHHAGKDRVEAVRPSRAPSQAPSPPLRSATAAPDMGFSRKSWGEAVPNNWRAAIAARMGGNAANLTHERDFASGPTSGGVRATERQWADLIGICNLVARMIGSPLGRENPEDGKRAPPATSNNRAKVHARRVSKPLAWDDPIGLAAPD